MEKIKIESSLEAVEQWIVDFLSYLEKEDCPKKICMQLVVALEEIMVNIVSYADVPEIEIQYEKREKTSITVWIIDAGKPFSPLEKRDPEMELPIEQRKIGGLGIYIVKKLIDIEYRRRDEKNIVQLSKSWG